VTERPGGNEDDGFLACTPPRHGLVYTVLRLLVVVVVCNAITLRVRHSQLQEKVPHRDINKNVALKGKGWIRCRNILYSKLFQVSVQDPISRQLLCSQGMSAHFLFNRVSLGTFRDSEMSVPKMNVCLICVYSYSSLKIYALTSCGGMFPSKK